MNEPEQKIAPRASLAALLQDLEAQSAVGGEAGEVASRCVDEFTKLTATLAKQEHRIRLLEQRLACLSRQVYGKKSERFDEHQGQLDFPDPVAPPPEQPPFANEAPDDESPPEGKKKKRRRAKQDWSKLPHERREHCLPAEEIGCPCCGTQREVIGEEVKQTLEFIPSSFKVIEDVRLKYACPRCHQGVALAEVPLSALEKRCHGPALLAEIIVRKYGDHLPLNRQVAIFARMGQRISKSSMCDDIEALAREFVPIVREMRLQVLEHPVVQCDETGILVCDRAAPGGSRKGYIRVYRGPIGAAVFEYTPTKEGHWAQEFLGDFAGYLQADAASSFDVLFVSGRITEVGCNAHARRKFFDIQEYAPSEAHTALLFYKHLAAIEKQATLSGASPEERRALRQERSRPLVEAYYKWLEESVPQQLPSSPLRKAMNYALNHRVALTRFLEDGHLQVTNNDAERALRQVAVGRKAWEFAGSEEGARRAATLYSLVQSCKELKVDPAEYLRDVLMRLGTTSASRIRDLTPIDWKAAREGARASPPSDGEVPSEVPTSASSADTSP